MKSIKQAAALGSERVHILLVIVLASSKASSPDLLLL